MKKFRIFYRIRQFRLALTAAPSAEDLELADMYLSPPLMALFMQMAKSEQAHSCTILRQLLEDGGDLNDLFVAALLHDVGKSRYPLSLWERVAVVLGKTFAHNFTGKWSQGEPRGWKRPFIVASNHAEWGAEMAQAAGASPLSAKIIKRHQEPFDVQFIGETTQDGSPLLEDLLLQRLIQLDNES